jgi:bacteriocin-like protein
MNDIIDSSGESKIELSEQELMQITGGGWLGDAWDWVEEAASDVADFVEDAATVTVEVVNWLGDVFEKIETTTEKAERVINGAEKVYDYLDEAFS